MVVKGAQGRVIAWLATGCILIFVMVLVGGITRLTGSGLSITEWKLISGVFPPMSDEAWKESFEAYQKIPQYGVQPQGFSLSDFKGIYWWEYIHRLLGRIIGIVFIVPYLYFLIRRRISKAFAIRLLILLLLVEAVIPRGNASSFPKFMDLTMLVVVGGHERTEAEYHALFEAAGFKLTQIIPTSSEMSVIEGVRA